MGWRPGRSMADPHRGGEDLRRAAPTRSRSRSTSRRGPVRAHDCPTPAWHRERRRRRAVVPDRRRRPGAASRHRTSSRSSALELASAAVRRALAFQPLARPLAGRFVRGERERRRRVSAAEVERRFSTSNLVRAGERIQSPWPRWKSDRVVVVPLEPMQAAERAQELVGRRASTRRASPSISRGR